MSDDDKTRYGGPVPARGASALTSPASEPAPTPATPPAAPAAAARGNAANALAAGFALREFEIERVIGEGGFSIVYLAVDKQLVRRVAIKEYMPGSLALRTADLAIVPKSERMRETFEAGLRSFVNEARLLAQFDHPSLVKVYRFWEERGTAYMVMPYYDGITLSQWRRRHGAADEAWLLRLIDSLFDALAQLHGQNCYHRDIAPDNILLLPGDVPVLLDLGAARRIIGDMTHALTVILKPGYAPVEQYAEMESMRQGAWTDIYALAAVMYFVIAGRAPPPAVARMMKDEMVPAATVGAGRYTPSLLAAIDTALAVLPEKRPQTLDALRALIGAPLSQYVRDGATAVGGMARPTSSPVVPKLSIGLPSPPPPYLPGDPGELLAAPSRVEAVALPPTGASIVTASPPRSETPPSPATSSSRRWVVPVGVVAVLAVGLGTWLLRSPKPSTAPAAPMVVKGPPARPAAPPQAAAVATPHELLARLYEARSPSIDVRAAPSATTLAIGKDALRFSVTSNTSGYVYVLMAGTDRNHLWLLFPHARAIANRIAANEMMLFPVDDRYTVTADGPAGTDRVLVMVSPMPRDFAALGLRQDEVVGEFSLSALATAVARGGLAAAAGDVQCAGRPNCDTSYGAAVFDITEIDPPAAAATKGTKP